MVEIVALTTALPNSLISVPCLYIHKKEFLSFIFFHTQPHPSWNAAAICQDIAKKQVFKAASSLCLPFCLGCSFAFMLLKLSFQEMRKVCNSRSGSAAIKAAALYSWLSSLCNELPVYAHPKCTHNEARTGWLTSHVSPLQLCPECTTVCAEKMKNTVISATYIMMCPLKKCTLKILEDTYNCSEDDICK